jgi:hypothetical protein
MGDHRATLSIKFEFHGKVYEIKDAWWNWDVSGELDRRVVEFFQEATEDGLRRYHEAEDVYQMERRLEETEKAERAELDRLKAKYEARPHPRPHRPPPIHGRRGAEDIAVLYRGRILHRGQRDQGDGWESHGAVCGVSGGGVRMDGESGRE